MRRLILSLGLLIGLSRVVIPARAQETPPQPVTNGVLTVTQEEASLAVDVPAGWQATATDPAIDAYGILTNRGTDLSPLTDIQMAFRDTATLNAYLEDTIDLNAANPAQDYLERYSQWETEGVLGVYTPPWTLEAGDYPAAMMLYMETAQDGRFLAESSLLLTIAIYVAPEKLAIILLEGSSVAGRDLYASWIEVISTLKLNGATPPFAADFANQLHYLEAPERLLARYEALSGQVVVLAPTSEGFVLPLPGEALEISTDQEVVTVAHPAGWNQVETANPLEIILLSPDESLRLTYQLIPLATLSDYTLGQPLAYVSQLLKSLPYEVLEEGHYFRWGVYPAGWVMLVSPAETQPYPYASLLLAQFPGAVFLAFLELSAAVPLQSLGDWRNSLVGIRYQGQTVGFNELNAALAELPLLPVEVIRE